MFLETDSSPLAPYFLRKDKFFFSQENLVYSEQKAFLEEHISNLFFEKRRLLSLTSISKQIATTNLAKEQIINSVETAQTVIAVEPEKRESLLPDKPVQESNMSLQ